MSVDTGHQTQHLNAFEMQRRDTETIEDDRDGVQKQLVSPHSYDVARVKVPAPPVTLRAHSAHREEASGKKQNYLRHSRPRYSSLSMEPISNGNLDWETARRLVVMATQNRGSTSRPLTSRSQTDSARLRSLSVERVFPMSDHRGVGAMTIPSRSASVERSASVGREEKGMLVLDKSEMDALEIPPPFSFGVSSSLADTAAVNGGAIFSFSDKKKDSFDGHVKTSATGSPHRHRKERRKNAKRAKWPSNSVHPVDVPDGRKISAPRHVDEFHPQKLEPLFEANVSSSSQTPNQSQVSTSGDGDRVDGNGGKKGKEKRHMLPPIVIKQSQRRRLSDFFPGMYPDVPFTYTPGANGPLSGSLERTPLLPAVQTPSVFASGLLTPIFTRSVRVDSGFEEHEDKMVRQYFPDMMLKIFIGTWNMHEQKVRV